MRILIVCAIFVSVVAFYWIGEVISDRRNEIEVMKDTILLAEAPQDYPKVNKETGEIRTGESVMVLRVGYGKDFRAWKVRNTSGQQGWFIEENDNIRLKR